MNLKENLILALENSFRCEPLKFAHDPIAESLLKRHESLDKLVQFLKDAGLEHNSIEPLGWGHTSCVLAIGANHVVRFGFGPEIPARADIPEMLQPIQSGHSDHFHWELLPRLDTSNITEDDVTQMTVNLKKRGIYFEDEGTDQLGRTKEGNLLIFDPGCIYVDRKPKTPKFQGPQLMALMS